MKLLAVFILVSQIALAEDLYIAQTSAGSDDGTSCANAHAASWFNDGSNWGSGAGKISAGDTVHLCGTITSALTMQASGTVGNRITIYFESGASISTAATTCLNAVNKTNFVVDGGVNGIIQNTANGTGLANSNTTSGIYASGSEQFEVKNLSIKNLYVHTNRSDGSIDFTTQGAVYCNGYGTNVSIHNCIFSNACWVLNMQSGNSSYLNISSNAFYNYDHGVGLAGGIMLVPALVNIYSNHFGTTSNWDSTANSYHHDGVHIFFGTGILSGVNFFDNIFDGDWGTNNTAHLFFEGDYNHIDPIAQKNFLIYNNAFIQWPNNVLNNGFLAGGGTNWSLLNNTFLGSGMTNSAAIYVTGKNLRVTNNVFSGVTTFIDSTTMTNGTYDYNVYANQIAAGNAAWQLNGSTYSTIANWRTATGGEVHSSLIADAGLNSSAYPLVGSAVIDSGASLSSLFTADLAGVSRPQGSSWDIGAYEFGSGGGGGGGGSSGGHNTARANVGRIIKAQ